jgi:hypothetical protein
VTGSGGDWGRPGSLTRGANGPETRDERDDLVRSLGERTGRKSGIGSGVGGVLGAGSELVLGVRWMVGLGIGVGRCSEWNCPLQALRGPFIASMAARGR